MKKSHRSHSRNSDPEPKERSQGKGRDIPAVRGVCDRNDWAIAKSQIEE